MKTPIETPSVLTFAAAVKAAKSGNPPAPGSFITMPQTMMGRELRTTLAAFKVYVTMVPFTSLPPRKNYPFAAYRVI